MLDSYMHENWSDGDGNPAGGVASGTGFAISWQNGPLGSGDNRKPPNGAFVETIIDVVIKRLEFYQSSKFACEENAGALGALDAALKHLQSRTARRVAAGTEGTHAV